MNITDDRSMPFLWLNLQVTDIGLDPCTFRLYAQIVKRAGGGGTCYESISSIAKQCAMSEGTVKRSFKKLIEKNMVRRVGGGRLQGKTNQWALIDVSKWVISASSDKGSGDKLSPAKEGGRSDRPTLVDHTDPGVDHCDLPGRSDRPTQVDHSDLQTRSLLTRSNELEKESKLSLFEQKFKTSHKYPTLLNAGLGEIWTGPGWNDFDPKVVEAARRHKKKHDLPADYADGQGFISNLIKQEDWAKLRTLLDSAIAHEKQIQRNIANATTPKAPPVEVASTVDNPLPRLRGRYKIPKLRQAAIAEAERLGIDPALLESEV